MYKLKNIIAAFFILLPIINFAQTKEELIGAYTFSELRLNKASNAIIQSTTIENNNDTMDEQIHIYNDSFQYILFKAIDGTLRNIASVKKAEIKKVTFSGKWEMKNTSDKMIVFTFKDKTKKNVKISNLSSVYSLNFIGDEKVHQENKFLANDPAIKKRLALIVDAKIFTKMTNSKVAKQNK